jgi:hypothetical protein
MYSSYKYNRLKQSRFCACEIIQLFIVVFYVVRDANKFRFGFVINETPLNWRPVERKSHSDKRLMF